MTEVETHIIAIILGVIIVYIITMLLKKLIKQPRPLGENGNYGMPSSTLSIITFIIFYVCIVSDDMWLWLAGIITILAFAYYKYNLKHHTVLQLIVGSMLGLTCALILHIIVQG